MPLKKFGSFVSLIPFPLGIGKVELKDGTLIPVFIYEPNAASAAEDISHTGGWRYATSGV
jgi:allophanate hydrolase